ncbi:MAG: hypothetical protein ACYC61_30240 [Isosphaeraceae bacterium]
MAISRRPGRAGYGRRAFDLAVLTLALAPLATTAARAQDQPPPDPTPVENAGAAQPARADALAAEADASGGQVLTQGPVHEAFATPVVHDPKASPVVTKKPPDPIQEVAPDQKPSGHNVQWIPGYWAWDGTRSDYLWVSGVWREPPPGTQWVPGYWNTADGGYQWVPGAWMPVSAGPEAGSDDPAVQPQPQAQATYLPPPPGSLESGPNSPQPNPNVVWTPGYWTWQGGGYAWRPGFWAAVQPGWVWMPPHYVWTPSGYLFVPGYWDLPVASRGLMFAPVYYPEPVYVQPGYVYTPQVTIVGSAVTANLFVQASTNSYAFGNYYAQNYVSLGIVPWFSFSFATGPPVYYDPLFSYYSVVYVRQNPQWVVQVREAYRMRRENVALRPPVTYAEQVRVMRNVSITRDITVVDHRNMAMPLHQLAADPIAGRNLRLERVSEAERQQLRRQATALHAAREHRATQERTAAREGFSNGPRTMSLPHSPIAAHPATHPAGHPGVHPATHPGAEGAHAQIAHHEAAAARDEPAGAPSARGRSEMGAAEARSFAPESRASYNPILRRPAPGGQFGRPGFRSAPRSNYRSAPRSNYRPSPEREAELRRRP